MSEETQQYIIFAVAAVLLSLVLVGGGAKCNADSQASVNSRYKACLERANSIPERCR